ncbi:hypothetical protein D9M71_795930 [compost metagenome]
MIQRRAQRYARVASRNRRAIAVTHVIRGIGVTACRCALGNRRRGFADHDDGLVSRFTDLRLQEVGHPFESTVRCKGLWRAGDDGVPFPNSAVETESSRIRIECKPCFQTP